MKFTTWYLFALMLIAAVACGVGRLLGRDAALGVVLIAGLFFAPSVLVFLLAPFSLPVRTRRRLTLVFLFVLGVPAAILSSVIVSPVLGSFLVLFALSFWAPQVVLLDDLQA